MTDSGDVTFESVQLKLRSFASERQWEQFHTPKNLALALASEVGEICQLLRWTSADGPLPDGIASELADVGIFLTYLSDACEIDLLEAMEAKIHDNMNRFPIQ